MISEKSNKRGSKNNTASQISHKSPAGGNDKETHQDLNMASKSSIEELLKKLKISSLPSVESK